MVSSFMDNDLTILDDTVRKEDQGEWKGLLDNEFLSEIQSNPSVKDVHPQMTERIVVPWEPEFSEVYMEKMYEYWMEQDYEEIKEEYQQHPEKFYSYMTAIDETEFDYLNGMLDEMCIRDRVLLFRNYDDWIRGFYGSDCHWKDCLNHTGPVWGHRACDHTRDCRHLLHGSGEFQKWGQRGSFYVQIDVYKRQHSADDRYKPGRFLRETLGRAAEDRGLLCLFRSCRLYIL